MYKRMQGHVTCWVIGAHVTRSTHDAQHTWRTAHVTHSAEDAQSITLPPPSNKACPQASKTLKITRPNPSLLCLTHQRSSRCRLKRNESENRSVVKEEKVLIWLLRTYICELLSQRWTSVVENRIKKGLNRRERESGSRPIREVKEGGVKEYLIQDREYIVESIVGVLFYSDRLVGYSERSRVVVVVRY